MLEVAVPLKSSLTKLILGSKKRVHTLYIWGLAYLFIPCDCSVWEHNTPQPVGAQSPNKVATEDGRDWTDLDSHRMKVKIKSSEDIVGRSFQGQNCCRQTIRKNPRPCPCMKSVRRQDSGTMTPLRWVGTGSGRQITFPGHGQQELFSLSLSSSSSSSTA